MEQATRDYIESLNKNKQYPECIEACENLFDEVEENDIWFIYMEMSKAYRHLKQYKNAMRSLQDATQHNNTGLELIKTYWQMGIIFKHTGKKKEALKFYDKCLDYYKRNNMYLQIGDMLKNKSRLLNRPEFVIEAIEMHRKANAVIDDLDDDFDNLHDIYVALGDYDNACKALFNIQNEELRTKLQKQLAADNSLEVVNI